MFQKTVEREKPYSKTDVEKIKRLGKQIKEARKDPEFRKAVRQFIKATT